MCCVMCDDEAAICRIDRSLTKTDRWDARVKSSLQKKQSFWTSIISLVLIVYIVVYGIIIILAFSPC